MTKKRKFHIRQKKTPQISFMQNLAAIAQQYMYAQQKLNPLIIAEHMEPHAALVLIACYADAVIEGKENNPTHQMTESDIIGASHLLILLWKMGLFKPSTDFPYTLEQMIAG